MTWFRLLNHTFKLALTIASVAVAAVTACSKNEKTSEQNTNQDDADYAEFAQTMPRPALPLYGPPPVREEEQTNLNHEENQPDDKAQDDVAPLDATIDLHGDPVALYGAPPPALYGAPPSSMDEDRDIDMDEGPRPFRAKYGVLSPEYLGR